MADLLETGLAAVLGLAVGLALGSATTWAVTPWNPDPLQPQLVEVGP